MVLRDNNIDFLKADLLEDEAAGDNADNNNEMEAGPCASTNYAERKLSLGRWHWRSRSRWRSANFIG